MSDDREEVEGRLLAIEARMNSIEQMLTELLELRRKAERGAEDLEVPA